VKQKLRIKVRYFTTLRELAGGAEEEIEVDDDATLADLIKKIALKYGEEARRYLYHKGNGDDIDPSIYFLINGTNARTLSGFNTKLKDGNIVAIVPPIGGG
jgi:molybdopterin synthase sulfur carrier subunit